MASLSWRSVFHACPENYPGHVPEMPGIVYYPPYRDLPKSLLNKEIKFIEKNKIEKYIKFSKSIYSANIDFISVFNNKVYSKIGNNNYPPVTNHGTLFKTEDSKVIYTAHVMDKTFINADIDMKEWTKKNNLQLKIQSSWIYPEGLVYIVSKKE